MYNAAVISSVFKLTKNDEITAAVFMSKTLLLRNLRGIFKVMTIWKHSVLLLTGRGKYCRIIL